jgi:hypothetical protein
MDKGIAHLKEAFAGESQANRKYLAFAEKADREGYPRVPPAVSGRCGRGGGPRPPLSASFGKPGGEGIRGYLRLSELRMHPGR